MIHVMRYALRFLLLCCLLAGAALAQPAAAQPPAPEINIQGNGVDIPNGSNSPSEENHTEFVQTFVGLPSTRNFRIENNGDANLTLGDITLPPGFSVTTSFSTPVPAGGSTLFTVECTAAEVGAYFGDISIINNDTDENPYTFAIVCLVNTPTVTPTPPATMSLDPLTQTVDPGDIFDVVVAVDPNGEPVNGAEVHLNFDPNILEVVNLTAGSALGLPLLPPSSDNMLGHVDYVAGSLTGTISTEFVLLTIQFRALASSSGTPLTIVREGTPRESGVTISPNGENVLGTVVNAEVIVTGFPTPEPTAEVTPEPTAEVTLEPTAEVTPEPTAEVTPEPTAEVTPEPTAEVTPEPTAEVTPEPTAEVTPEPTAEVTPEPTAEVTPEPTAEVTPEPTAEVTPEPTAEVTPEPTVEVTPEPSAQPGALTLNPGSLPDALLGFAYNIQVIASGGTGPYSYFISSGGLPPGVILTGGGQITGVPNTAGTYTFTVSASDSSSPARTGSRTYTLNVPGAGAITPTPNPALLTPTLPPLPPPTAVPPQGVVVNTIRASAVRTGPYLGASLITIVRSGATVDISARSNAEGAVTWYFVTFPNGQAGWVSGRNLTLNFDPNILPVRGSVFDEIDNAPDLNLVGTINASVLNMRVRPSQRTQIIERLTFGTEVRIIGRTIIDRRGQSAWYHVRLADGRIGWVAARYVTVGSLRNVPVR